MITAVFISDSIYYASGDSLNFSPYSYSTPLILNNGKYHGIIFTSEMTLTSCYEMPASSASSTSYMAVFSII